MPRLRALLVLCLLGLSAPPVAASAVSGKARVVDGDTLQIGAEKIRIHGIDAPETGQTCRDARGRIWACGKAASDWLTQRLRGRIVRCGGVGRDRYGRLIARCISGGEDIGGLMVAHGLALAYRKYSNDYVAAEQQAEAGAVGLWSGSFTPPWRWRATGVGAAHTDCPIKGNISRNGRIYHMPGDHWYARTRIDAVRGERWFCTEAEARRAGWRRAGG